MLNNAVISKLKEIVGKQYVLTAKEDLTCYSYDSTPLAHMPDVVVEPASTGEIAEIIRLANEMKIPVVPRGGGTNLSGGSIPVLGGIVLALHRMNRIVEVDADNLTATVEPGVITSHLHHFGAGSGDSNRRCH